MLKQKRTIILLTACLLILGLGIGLGYFAAEQKNSRMTQRLQTTMTPVIAFPLLSQRIFVEEPNDTIVNFAALRLNLRSYLAEQPAPFSFYFEYLPTGTSIKIKPDEKLVGASLLKVPMVMNLYKAAEDGKIDLSKIVTIEEKHLNNASGTLWKNGLGKQMTLAEAAKYTIIDSHNTALSLLIDSTDESINIYQEAIDELDIPTVNDVDGQTNISSSAYASLLKCLYLSCFLTKEHSQQILSWMSESVAPPRLVAGVPEDVPVAHKYGTSSGHSESDCGIVYVPKRPYLLCMMVDAPPEQANTIIADISQRVYRYVSTVQR